MSSVAIAAPVCDIEFERGKHVELFFRYRDFDTGDPIAWPGGYALRGQVRAKAGRVGVTTSTTLLLDLATGDRLTFVDVGGVIKARLFLSAADTIALSEDNSKVQKLVYAIELYETANPTINVIALVSGAVVVLGETAR